jgi:hypothetical protein
MLSYADIREFQAEAAAQASRKKLSPMMAWPEDVGNINSLRRIPNVGTYLRDGWERVAPSSIKPCRTEYSAGKVDGVPGIFVDKSGFGAPGEPAMTIQEFADWIEPNYGYAIVEEGQFQITIGVFKRVLKMGKYRRSDKKPV